MTKLFLELYLRLKSASESDLDILNDLLILHGFDRLATVAEGTLKDGN